MKTAMIAVLGMLIALPFCSLFTASNVLLGESHTYRDGRGELTRISGLSRDGANIETNDDGGWNAGGFKSWSEIRTNCGDHSACLSFVSEMQKSAR